MDNHSKHIHKDHHSVDPANLRGKRLLWVVLLNFSITIVEFLGGF